MTKEEFLKKLDEEKPYILPYAVVAEKRLYEPCVIGAYSDGVSWTVYHTDKNGEAEVLRHTRDESSAFDFLYREVMKEAQQHDKR